LKGLFGHSQNEARMQQENSETFFCFVFAVFKFVFRQMKKKFLMDHLLETHSKKIRWVLKNHFFWGKDKSEALENVAVVFMGPRLAIFAHVFRTETCLSVPSIASTNIKSLIKFTHYIVREIEQDVHCTVSTLERGL
jgi:hypothetical protein